MDCQPKAAAQHAHVCGASSNGVQSGGLDGVANDALMPLSAADVFIARRKCAHLEVHRCFRAKSACVHHGMKRSNPRRTAPRGEHMYLEAIGVSASQEAKVRS